MKAPNQKIVDQDEVTAVAVNKSLLSVDYASTSTQHSEELNLTCIVQRTSKFLTTCKKVTLGSRNLRSVSPRLPLSLAHPTTCFQKKKRHNNKRVIESSMGDAPVTAHGDEKMQVDEKPIIPEARDLDVNFVDDDDLQAVLARSRRAKLRKPQKLSPEEVAKKSTFQVFSSFCLPYV